MIIRDEKYLNADGLPPQDMLRSVLREHLERAAEMAVLRNAYNANSAILNRQRRRKLPNNRIAHPYARYITTLAVGYMVGKPVTYSVSEPSKTLQQIQDIFYRCSEPAENVQLARDQSIYGKGLEYVHLDANNLPKTTAVNPEQGFVVYSDDVDYRPLFGVYYTPKTRADGTDNGFRVWVVNDSLIARYDTQGLEAITAPNEVEEHFFGGVPLIEYWNDETEKGDFEWVLPQLDAYDKLQSDRVNDKEQFVDKLLVLTGAILETDENGRTPQQQLQEDHAIQLPDAQSKAEFLSSEMHEADVEVLRAALVEDIHKHSMIPDLSDRNFAANASGVAMRYKLWGFDQLIGIKKRWFAEALRERLRLYVNYLTLRGMPALDVSDIKITFTPSLPANTLENAQIMQMAMTARAVSTQTAIRTLHDGEEWTEDEVQEEVQRIRDEQGTNLDGPMDAGMGDFETLKGEAGEEQ